MYQKTNVKLDNLLLSMSDTLDLAIPDLNQHQMRTAFIAQHVGKRAGLTPENEINLFIASLMHDIGALSPEEKLDVKQIEIENTEEHCILGEKLLQRVEIFKSAATIIRFHHTKWSEVQNRLDPQMALCSQIIMLADYIERKTARDKFILHQDKLLIEYANSLAGEFIKPELVQIFTSISKYEEFWLDLTSSRLYSLLLSYGIGRHISIEMTQMLDISEMFRDMIDFRSRFTATHSSGVAATAATLSKMFGFTESEVELMEVAGNFHDIGKMIIPNSILEKPGKLTAEEFAVMKQHTYYTYSVLNSIGGINLIAEWAAFHHERLDGTGYPFHVTSKELSVKSRIMAVADIFTALAEERPYRKPLSEQEVLSIIMTYGQKNWLDKSIVEVLKKNYGEIVDITRKKQAVTKDYYEREFSSGLIK